VASFTFYMSKEEKSENERDIPHV